MGLIHEIKNAKKISWHCHLNNVQDEKKICAPHLWSLYLKIKSYTLSLLFSLFIMLEQILMNIVFNLCEDDIVILHWKSMTSNTFYSTIVLIIFQNSLYLWWLTPYTQNNIRVYWYILNWPKFCFKLKFAKLIGLVWWIATV